MFARILPFVLLLAVALLPAAAQSAKPATGAPAVGRTAAKPGLLDVALVAIGAIVEDADDHDDDCYTAAFAWADGADCGTEQEEMTQTGYYSAQSTATADKSPCAKADAKATASEGFLGSWMTQVVEVDAQAKAFGIHYDGDVHETAAAASAKVDTTAKLKAQGQTMALGGGPRGGSEVVLQVRVHPAGLAAPASHPSVVSYADWQVNVQVDGVTRFSFAVSVDQSGATSVTGDLPASAVTTVYDAAEGRWVALIAATEIQLPVADLAGGQELEIHVETTSEMNSMGGAI